MAIITRFPTTNGAGTITATPWTNPANAYANDAVDAAGVTDLGVDAENQWGGFGFDAAIPAGAPINSVKINVEYGNSFTASQLQASAVISGTYQTAHIDGNKRTYPVLVVYDITADRAWTRADLLDAVFKASIYISDPVGSPTNWQLDYLSVTVDYTGAPPITDVYLFPGE